MSFVSRLRYADSPNIDAFGRLRVSEPETLFSAVHGYGDSLVMEHGSTGTGANPLFNANTRMMALTAGPGSGTSFMQSYQYLPYQPGKSQLVEMTGVFGAALAGAVMEAGYFDAANGVIYRQNGTTGLWFALRASTSGSVAETAVQQASWNLDTLDGNGPSRIAIDPTKDFILVIDLQFLGMGRVRVGFNIGGSVVYAHQFLASNILSVPFMQHGALPVQYLLTATATGSPSAMYGKCSTVISEGGFLKDLGYSFSTGEGTATAGSATRTHLLSVRPKTTFNSLPNRILFLLDEFNAVVTGNNPVLLELCVGATFSGAPTWADVATGSSGFEFAIGGTFQDLTTASGYVLDTAYVTASVQNKSSAVFAETFRHPITLNRAGANFALGTLTLLATGIGGNSATRATFTFREFR